CQQESTWPTF
nr:immunoglobulin light chain junction region [Macaca mulatta]MPN90848.1 immunoglobulin light chain junction region [Macaca mulatta]MPN90885.1 immunoglobulin light chain junction region [Macaca mulatta]MPN91083.1 immunoglobulin light chain junction region [Macaca mulatta]MPN91102.1 immunoglobulin light chain junction region [Macaca mulatta]